MSRRTPPEDRWQFGSPYLATFASSFGVITVLTLLPTYVDLLDPSGLEIGLFVTALWLARLVGIVPLAWPSDRDDKRTVMVAGLLLGIAAPPSFPRSPRVPASPSNGSSRALAPSGRACWDSRWWANSRATVNVLTFFGVLSYAYGRRALLER